jgi:site-specific DNA recombinase
VLATPTAAAIYARISSDPDHDQLGVTRQLEDCRALAARRGWPVLDEYVDDDKSAWSGKPRPEYKRMLGDIEDGQVDAVIVWHTDRLHRHPKELEEYMEACKPRSVPTHTVTSGDLDLTNPDGQFIARMLGAVARKESDDKSRRIRRKHEEIAQAGKIAGGGTRPYGYLDDRLTVVQTEAEIIREMAERILAGDSLRSLANDLNRRQIPTVSGREWKTQVVRRLLLSARISGQRSHKDQIVATAVWPAIITPEQGARLALLFGDPTRKTNRAARRYLLSGIMRCAVCDTRMIGRPRADGARRYICAKGPGLPGCGGVAILAEPMERFIVEAVLHRLDSPALAAALAGGTPPDEVPAATRLEFETSSRELDELAAAYGQRLITLPEWLIARKPIEARIENAKRSLARHTKTSILAPYVGASSKLRELWEELPLARQRAIVAAILDRVSISRAAQRRGAFDESRAEPVWRV